MTLNQKYYAINTALNTYLLSKGITCPVIKYGIDPATLKRDLKNNKDTRYPYLQTYVTNPTQQSWTSKESGILTTFDFQLSFFTAPSDEFVNDKKYFYPFEVAKNALGDIDLNILAGIASIMTTTGHYESGMKSGQMVPAAFMIYRMRAVCSYEAIVPDAGETTDLDQAITFQG